MTADVGRSGGVQQISFRDGGMHLNGRFGKGRNGVAGSRWQGYLRRVDHDLVGVARIVEFIPARYPKGYVMFGEVTKASVRDAL